jgi:hypothetical protein
LLDELIENANLITGLVIEFHDVDLHIGRLHDFVAKCPLTLVHTHCKGTPLAIERTFTAAKVGDDLVSTLPGDLDMPNNKDKADYQLVFYDGV